MGMELVPNREAVKEFDEHLVKVCENTRIGGEKDMFLNKDCAQMMRLLKIKYKQKRKAWKADFGNRRLAVEACFIHNIYNDIVFLIRIPLKISNERYFNLILRNCFEQVIIFRYLEQKSKTNPDIFLDYMGDNIDFDAICEEQDAFQIMKKLGGERTTQYKNKFFPMAKEFEDTNCDTSLYKLYGVYADYCHSSYYHSIGNIIFKEKKCKKEDILVAILVILTEFYAGFDED